MRRLFAAVGVVGLVFGLAVAADPQTPQSPSISALVEQLGAERFADREAAATALEKIGLPASSALASASRHDNPEVRERAAALLVKLRRAAESNSRIAARRIKLDYREIPLGTALNDLKARTGLNVVLDQQRVTNPLRKITCETQELPVWEALETFCSAAGLREAFNSELEVPKPAGPRRGYTPPPQIPNADAVPITLIDGKPERLAGDRATAVRILALPADFPGHKLTLGSGDFTLCLDVTPTPGLNWQEVVGVKISRLVDSAGRAGGAGIDKSALPAQDPNGMLVFARPGVAMRFDPRGNPIYPDTIPNPRVLPVPLKLSNPAARSLKRVEGAIYGEVLLLNQHLITISDLKKNVGTGHTAPGELKFTIQEIREPAGRSGLGFIRCQLEYPSPQSILARRGGFNPGWPEAPQNPTHARKVEAFDAAGKPYPLPGNGGFTDISDDGMVNIQNFTLNFRAETGLPAKLVVVGPKTVLVEVPFVLENVPLP